MTNMMRKAVRLVIKRYRESKLEYKFWQLRPKLYGPVMIIALVASLLSFAQGVNETSDTQQQWKAVDSVAQCFEQAPDIMLSNLEKNKADMSSYEYELKYQQYRFFARNASSIAERIRDENGLIKWANSGYIIMKQVTQTLGGKIAGQGASYIGKKIGPGMLEKGMELSTKGYTAAGRIFARGGIKAFAIGDKIGEASSNLAYELTVLATNEDPPPSSELQKALTSPEMKELFDLLRKVTEQNPDKLMTAALHQTIYTVGLERDEELYPDNEYRADVMNVAKRFIKMTQAGGSPTSIWKDVNALAAWLAGKAGRALPEEEKTGTAVKNIFTKDDFPPPPGDLVLTLGDITLYNQEKGSQKLSVTYEKTEEIVTGKWKISDGTTRTDTTTIYLAKAALYVYVFESESLAKSYFESDVRSQSKHLKTQSRAKVLEDEDTEFVFTTGYYSYGLSGIHYDYDLERYILYKNSFIQVQGMSKGEADANSYCDYLKEQAKTLVDQKGYLGKKS